MFSLTKYKQLSFLDQVSELNTMSFETPEKFLKLLNENFEINAYIPQSFKSNYYKTLGSKRDFQLPSVLAALIIMHFFKIPTISLLCIFLAFSPAIRDFCMFESKVPDESFFSRFKIDFEKDIASFFDSLVLAVLPICKEYDENLPKSHPHKGFSTTLIYDTSGLKPQVTENNPKYITSEINKQKRYAKIYNNDKVNPYAAAYKSLPKCALANPEIKLDFVNGHFGYFYKFGALTNGFGIPLRINFFNTDFYSNIKSDFETPQEQKYEFDNASLKTVLEPFLPLAQKYNFTTFLGDSEFDSYDNFGFLKNSGFQKVLIPINSRNSSKSNPDLFPVNSVGTPLCPLTKEEFLPAGSCKGENRSFRLKYICPKSEKVKGSSKLTCKCDTMCRETKSTVTTYKYPDKDFRLYPGIQRNSEEWVIAYKGRTIIEREFSSLKKNPSISSPRTINTAAMRADLLLAASARLVTVILAHAINKPEYMRNRFKLFKFTNIA